MFRPKSIFFDSFILFTVFNIAILVEAREKPSSDESSEAKTENNAMIDRLAVNLAGAFAKSLLPERSESTTSRPEIDHEFARSGQNLDREYSNNVRRAPESLNQFQGTPLVSGNNPSLYSTMLRPVQNPMNLNMFQDGGYGAGASSNAGDIAGVLSDNSEVMPSIQGLPSSNMASVDPRLLALMASGIRRAPQTSNLYEDAAGSAYSALNSFNANQLSSLGITGLGNSGQSTGSSLGLNHNLASLSSVSPSTASLLNNFISPLALNPYGNTDTSNIRLPTSLQAPTSILPSLGGASSGFSGSQLANLIPGIASLSSLQPGNLNVGAGGVEAINALKKQKYLAELQQHQHALNEYSAKQLEYLDKQARYQQELMNHHAGAALLMQQQQQEFLNKMKNKYAGIEEQKPLITKTDFEDTQTGGRVLDHVKDPFRQYAAKTAVRKEFEEKPDRPEREEFASDEYLKKFFKENYDIEFPEDDELESLSEDDKQTLKELKEHLINEAQKGGKILKNGVFTTMKEFSQNRRSSNVYDEGEDLEKELAQLEEHHCSKCSPMEMKRIRGAWTQVYGNPDVLKKTFSTITTLMEIENFEGKSQTTDMKTRHANCVGMESKFNLKS